ncbi:MAG TPA: M20/M25/M40 family metallo-hydrolase [Blastocatellia bacterium]|nr:M20/M25/M40 family metallo-hydrolase [Blastocatellia bacterium]
MIRKSLVVLLSGLLVYLVVPVSRAQATMHDMATANQEWLEGKYVDALRDYAQLLKAPGGDKYLEEIALQTGELYQTEEITTDGRTPKLSPDGKLFMYEVGIGSGPSTGTRILQTSGAHNLVAEIPGVGAVISPSGQKVAYLKPTQNDEIAKAQTALDNAKPEERNAAQATLNHLHAKYNKIFLRDLTNQHETELHTEGLLKSTLAFGADNQTVYFVGGKEDDTSRNDIYAVTENGAPVSVTDTDGFKTNPIIDPSGKALLFLVANQTPFPAPRNGGQGAGQRGGGGNAGQGRGFQRQPTKFVVANLSTHAVKIVNGTAPTISNDGSYVAFIAANGAENSIMTMPMFGEASLVLKTNDKLDAPAFSPNGQKIAYQRMQRDDWEIYVTQTDGKEDIRVTREIQHDVLPHFISNDRLIGVIGEPRHRRSYLYDLSTMTRQRLFHNNTVRTIAPEYSWAVTPDATTLLISAERDGDTVSPERGVYLVHLDKKVSKDQVLARIQDNITSEVALRDKALKMFEPIAEDVKKVLEIPSTDRIFEYEKTLFDFDSKYISRPGNRKALEFLYGKYRSFGYDSQYQWFSPNGAFEGKTANIVSVLKGTENPELVYVVGSHFDSVLAGPGADDDTTGTSALLEAARALANKPMPATIIFVSFTGEEAGLLGSREFVRQAIENKMKIVGVLNNDMIGWSNDNRLDNTIRYSSAGIRDVQHGAAMLFTKLITYDTKYYKSTDAGSFYDAYGDIIGGIGSYPVLGNPHYHTSTDLLEGINHQLVTETCKTTIATLMLLASSPSPVKDLRVVNFDGKNAELAWTASPEKSVRSYNVTYTSAQGGQKQIKVNDAHATIQGVKAGTDVTIKAVNSRGLESWDVASAKVTAPAKAGR